MSGEVSGSQIRKLGGLNYDWERMRAVPVERTGVDRVAGARECSPLLGFVIDRRTQTYASTEQLHGWTS